jgi:hypothetical protein
MWFSANDDDSREHSTGLRQCAYQQFHSSWITPSSYTTHQGSWPCWRLTYAGTAS